MEHTKELYGYVCMYNSSKKVEIYAESIYDAKRLAIKVFNPPKAKQHLVTVMLAEVNNEPVIHTPDF